MENHSVVLPEPFWAAFQEPTERSLLATNESLEELANSFEGGQYKALRGSWYGTSYTCSRAGTRAARFMAHAS